MLTRTASEQSVNTDCRRPAVQSCQHGAESDVAAAAHCVHGGVVTVSAVTTLR